MRRWEHLVLQPKPGFVGIAHYFTDRHTNLGADLQQALRALEEEGWEMVCTCTIYTAGAGNAFILKRPRPYGAGEDQDR